MVQSFQDKLKLYAHEKYQIKQDKPGDVLSEGDNKVTVSKEE